MMISEQYIGKHVEGSGHGLIYLPGGTEEKQNCSQDNWYPAGFELETS
jgi:hypothetical protein